MNTTSQNKVISLEKAVSSFVKPNSHISIGGFTINRNPMAAVYEIIRQNIKGLHLYAHSNGQGVDELIGAGCVSNLEIAYSGSGKFASTCIRFKKASQNNSIEIEDYTNYQMSLRFLAGSMGVPFLPTRSSLGTDIINKWGFSKEIREQNQHIPNQKLIVMDNPFTNSKFHHLLDSSSNFSSDGSSDSFFNSASELLSDSSTKPSAWCNIPKVVLVPAVNPDVTIIHVQKADRQGNCRIDGLSFADVEQAKAAHHVILTCEELVEEDELKIDSNYNSIPFIYVDAVVHVPYGAYPTACYKYYDYDPKYLKMYADYAEDDDLYMEYLSKFIINMPNHKALIDYIGGQQINLIKADPKRGYAVNLDRK